MPEIILHAEPGKVMSWEAFQAEKPPFSIALDGYVAGQTKFSSSSSKGKSHAISGQSSDT